MTAFRKHLPTIALVIAFAVGVCLLAYPTVSDWWNQRHASRAVTTYSQTVDALDEAERASLLAAARDYNVQLAQAPLSFELSDDQLAAYADQLSTQGTDVMAVLEIERIGVKLPIYHGTSDGVLQAGAGHLAGSSLPVGGPSTHAVLMGHRGLPSAKLLTDLDQMEVGDSFRITVMGEELLYEVDQILIVEPDDLSELGIQPGEDLCTLVTCTPYGVNSHRLLVRGHRVDAVGATAHLTADAVRVNPVLVTCAVAVPLLLVLAVVALVGRARGRF